MTYFDDAEKLAMIKVVIESYDEFEVSTSKLERIKFIVELGDIDKLTPKEGEEK